MQMKKRTKLLLLTLELLAVVGIAFGVLYAQRHAVKQDEERLSSEEIQYRYTPSIQYQGQDYALKRNLSTLLLIGTDNFVDDAKQYDDLPYNFNLADFLVILVFDRSNKTITPVQICRDTMCDVTTSSGTVARMQITLSHSYGTGKEDSCIYTRNAVENLLFGVPLDNFLSFTMDAVPLMNDLVGGVTLTLEDDIPALGPEYTAGAEITLRGKDALSFVRYRDTSLLDDNLRRMSHQRLYLDAFTAAAREAVRQDPDFAVKCYRAAENFLCTDLSAEQVTDMVNELCDYTLLPVRCPGGVYVEAEPFPEFLMDESSLWDCVREVFCA